MHKVLINFGIVTQSMAESGALFTMPALGSRGFWKCQDFFFFFNGFVYFCSLYLLINLCNDLIFLPAKLHTNLFVKDLKPEGK